MTDEDKKIAARWASAQSARNGWDMMNAPTDPEKKVEAAVAGAQIKAEYFAAYDAYQSMIDRLAGRAS